MDRETRIELSMVILDLRLASRVPSELVCTRLTPDRLRDMATVLEQMRDRDELLNPSLKGHAANDTDVPARIVAGLSWHR